MAKGSDRNSSATAKGGERWRTAAIATAVPRQKAGSPGLLGLQQTGLLPLHGHSLLSYSCSGVFIGIAAVGLPP